MSTSKNSAHVYLPAATAVEESRNQKIGPVSATMVSQSSCPTYCPFIHSGCYAEGGNSGFTTRRLNRSTLTDPVGIATAEASAIDTLSGTRPLRLHVVGDCTSDQTARILAGAVRDYKRRGKQNSAAWTYSHAWRDISRRSFGPISVLASCESMEQVLRARRKGYATAIVVDRFASTKAYVADGVKIVPCPQQTGKTENCATCRLCWNDKALRQTGVTIGFEAHGMQAKSVRNSLIQISMQEKSA
jgi:hypothetical protein